MRRSLLRASGWAFPITIASLIGTWASLGSCLENLHPGTTRTAVCNAAGYGTHATATSLGVHVLGPAAIFLLLLPVGLRFPRLVTVLAIVILGIVIAFNGVVTYCGTR